MSDSLDIPELREKLHQLGALSAAQVESLCRLYDRPVYCDFRVSSLHVGAYQLAIYKSVAKSTAKNTEAKSSFNAGGKSKKAILFHGLFDHSFYLANLIPLLKEHHYEIWMVDLPGHGLSLGERGSVMAFSDYGEILKAVAQEQDLFIGFSTGCVGWIEAPVCRQAVLIAPLIRPRAFALMKILVPILSALKMKFNRRSRRCTHDSEFLKWRSLDPQAPPDINLQWSRALIQWNKILAERAPDTSGKKPLVIYGTRDGTLNALFGARFFERVFKVEVEWIEGGEHQLLNEKPEYIQKLLEMIGEYLRET